MRIKLQKVANAIMLASFCAFFLVVVAKYASLIDIPSNPSGDIQTSPEPWTVLEHIPLAAAEPGMALDHVVRSGPPYPGPELIRVSAPQTVFNLESLNDLRHHMRIRTAAEALQFVRLRTAIDLGYCWGDGPHFEITHYDPVAPSKFKQFSGQAGVLSPEAFRLGGFTPPVVKSVAKGYEIVRWVWVSDGGTDSEVQQWRETVAPDGTYSCDILLRRIAPKLPDTQWFGLMGKA